MIRLSPVFAHLPITGVHARSWLNTGKWVEKGSTKITSKRAVTRHQQAPEDGAIALEGATCRNLRAKKLAG